MTGLNTDRNVTTWAHIAFLVPTMMFLLLWLCCYEPVETTKASHNLKYRSREPLHIHAWNHAPCIIFRDMWMIIRVENWCLKLIFITQTQPISNKKASVCIVFCTLGGFCTLDEWAKLVDTLRAVWCLHLCWAWPCVALESVTD